jgi:hypothetical protein
MKRLLPIIALGVALAACNADALAPTATVRLVGVTPTGGSVGVATDAAIVLTWDHAMHPGMEAYVDLHRGGLDGPIVPMTCAWSADSTALTCIPQQPLEPATRYTLHVGGGMLAHDGGTVDMTPGMGMGGAWATDSMMNGGNMMGGGRHGGGAMTGDGWSHGNHPYGMVFEFTTA